MNASSDHPIFKRLSRQQLVVRRRSIGFQTLVFDASLPKTERCKHCGRPFSAVWKEFLCHVCGMWFCQPCSSVIEREREINRIQYIRTCYHCLPMLNKWSDPDLLTQFLMAPWVVPSSQSQFSLSLSDALRKNKSVRHGVMVVLQYLRLPVEALATHIDEISDADWIAATTPGVHTPLLPSGDSIHGDMGAKGDEYSSLVESAQHLVQMCFEVVIPELPREECVFAEADGTRSYAVYYDPELETPHAPIVDNDTERELCIDQYNLLNRSINDEAMQLICDLAAKELDANTAFISVVQRDTQHAVASRPGCECSTLPRSETFCAFALTSKLPFLVRDAALDIRFRNFEVVRGKAQLAFYIVFPILAEDGSVLASLCVVDTKAHKHVTTMQYSILKKLSEIISTLWREQQLRASI